jgi:uncharacterized surface protein with fasciclin (FAS1) repeats
LTNTTYDHYPAGGLPVNVKVSGSIVNVYYGANYANVTSADNTASNGVIHVINSVLIPPGNVNSTALQAGLDKFVNALNSTNTTVGINKKSGITIFAPNDDALSSDTLSKYNSSQLANILAYHVVEGLYFSTNLSSLTGPVNVTTEAGTNVTVDASSSGVQLTDMSGNHTAHVIRTDILTDNGVIHIIDSVLIPSQNATGVPTNSTNITSSSGVGSLIYGVTSASSMAVSLTVLSALFSLLL